MDYSVFCKELPVLYGQITINGRSKVGQFKPIWSHLTNSRIYQFYTHKGHKGSGGFTLNRAYSLFLQNRLSLNPQEGNPNNYI